MANQKPLLFQNMTAEEIKAAQEAVAMKDLEHFKRWLQESDRAFLIFVAKDLLDALAFAPDNLVLFQQVVYCYTAHRLGIVYDQTTEIEPLTGEAHTVPLAKDDRLTIAEKDRLIRRLAADLFDAVPGWSLESEPIG